MRRACLITIFMVPREAIERNLQRVRTCIERAAHKSGRTPDAIKLIAVTKYVGLPEIETLHSLGVRDFGEARIQDAEKKIRELSPSFGKGGAGEARWHLIGHLQT